MSDLETPATKPRPAPAPRKWLRRTVALLAVLLVLAAAGFAALPSVLKSQLPKYVAGHYKRTLTLGKISINPFKLRVEVHDLRLAEADGRPIAGFEALVADLEWSSITRRAWHLAELRLTGPRVLLDIAPDGRINLAELVDDITRDSPKDEHTALPRMVIDVLTINQGHADISDRQAGYANALAPFDLHIDHLSTLPEDRGPYAFSAKTAHGGTVHWKGEISLNPITINGVVSGESLSLPELSAYLKPYIAASVAGGRAAFSIPYRAAYRDGKLDARIDEAGVGVEELALKADGAALLFFSLHTLHIGKIRADYTKRELEAGDITLDGGQASANRNAEGKIDLLALLKARPAAAAAPPGPPSAKSAESAWKLKVGHLGLDNFSLAFEDMTAPKPLSGTVERITLQAGLEAGFGETAKATVGGLEAQLHGLRLRSGDAKPVEVGTITLAGGKIDIAARIAELASVTIGDGRVQIRRDAQGRINLLDFVPGPGTSGPGLAATPASGASQPWRARVEDLSLERFTTDFTDEASGIALQAKDIGAKVANVSNDPKQALKFSAGFALREGGKFSLEGHANPAQATLDAKVAVEGLMLKPAQPLLARYLKLKLAGGTLSTKGDLSVSFPEGKPLKLRYAGGFAVDAFRLDENDGKLFASWKKFGADRLTLTLAPDRLVIPELRLAGLNARLLIEADHSLNAARLLVRPPATKAGTTPAAASGSPALFPVAIRQLRVQNGRLEFSDQSLRPQFAAKIHDLGGVINGLSTNKASRSQIELDGRVDEYGQARIRGDLNPFAPFSNTNVALSFKNVDLASVSPYAMKFAGYKIASGKMSLDLNYKLRDRRLEGTNSVVFNKLTLGEKVESPDAMDLPLKLALAILTDSSGKIDLDLPVSGNLDDPQFSYGAVIWKAVTSLLTRIVTAPFRAIGALFGVSAEQLQSIDFDPGSAKLQPPEREKLKQVAGVLAKRAQLALAVPGRYSEAVDGLALRVRGVRQDIARRAGISVAGNEEPGPLALQDPAVRKALRAVLTERDGEAAWDARKAEAERTAAAANATISMLQRARRLARGEPQVADLAPFYRGIEEHLVQTQPLAPDALQRLAAQRAGAIIDALKAGGVEAGRLKEAKPTAADAAPGKPVAVKLELSTR